MMLLWHKKKSVTATPLLSILFCSQLIHVCCTKITENSDLYRDFLWYNFNILQRQALCKICSRATRNVWIVQLWFFEPSLVCMSIEYFSTFTVCDISAASAGDIVDAIPAYRCCYWVVLWGGKMSDFSSTVACSAFVVDTRPCCIPVLLDCCLCIHHNTRFAVFIVFMSCHVTSLCDGWLQWRIISCQ